MLRTTTRPLLIITPRPHWRPAALVAAALMACLVAFAVGCPGASREGPRRRASAEPPGVTLVRGIAPVATCPAPGREGIHRWFVAIAARVVQARQQLGRAAAGAHRLRDVLLYSCLSAKSRVLDHLRASLVEDAEALKRRYPPDPRVTGRLLASCEQARLLVEAARHCLGVAPPP